MLGREVFRVLGIVGDDLGGHLVGERDELRHRPRRIAQNHEECPEPRLAQVESGLKD